MAKNNLISAINNLTPYQVIDAKTGEIIDDSEYCNSIQSLINYCQLKIQETLNNDKEKLQKLLEQDDKIGSPTGYAWKYDIRSDLKDYPKTAKALSRVEKIIQHQVVTLFSSYYNNPNPKKNYPTVSKMINLGAADKQIASIELKDNILILDFKCWDKHLKLFFLLPLYVQQYDINKMTLPIIRWNEKLNKPVFTFSIYENYQYKTVNKSKISKNIIAAYDLGRVKPYCLSIVNQKGGIIAEYETSYRLKLLNDRRERLIKEKKEIYNKIDAYEALGVYPEKVVLLRQEVRYKTSKITDLGKVIALQMGAEVFTLCVKHNVDIITCEDLTWVNNATGRSSKWNHSHQQFAIEHSCKRRGIKQVKRSAKNTSKTCSDCGSTDVKITSNRVVSCNDCNFELDRDRSSARFQARREAFELNKKRFKELLSLRRVDGSDFCWFPVRFGVGTGVAVGNFQATNNECSTDLIELVTDNVLQSKTKYH